MSENEGATHLNLRDTMKVVLRGKFIMVLPTLQKNGEISL